MRNNYAVMVLVALCFTVVAGSSPTAAVSRDITIVSDGRPSATIIIAADAGEKVRLAAEELQRYIEKIAGARLPVVTDAEKPQGVLILVGKSKLTDEMGVAIPAGSTPNRREEGFIIIGKDDRLVLAGNNDSSYHGTEYAVYELLNRLGVRWFMPGDYGEVVPAMQTITIPEISLSEKPDFAERNWWGNGSASRPDLPKDEARWKIRNKMNPDSGFGVPSDGTAVRITAGSDLLEDHPEYFALKPDGTRSTTMPNLSNPQAVQIAADIIKDVFRKNPQSTSFGFAPDDGLPVDYSPETRKLNQGFTSMCGRPGVPGGESITAEWMRFVNQVTIEVRKEFPDKYITTNGYANRDIPPLGIKLDDHIVVMVAAIWCCNIHAFDDPHCWQRRRMGEIIRKWTEICPNVWLYGYNEQMLMSGITPLPEIHKLRREFPLLKKWGVLGFIDETRNAWAEPGIMSKYLRARLEWDADLNVDAVLNDFYRKWYGKAADPMSKYYGALDAAVEKTSMHGHEDRAGLIEIYTPALMKKLEKEIARARELADTDSAKLHVQADWLIHQHLQGYVAMCNAELAGDYLEVIRQIDKMKTIREQIYAINAFYMWHNEERWVAGIGYWGIEDRQAYYRTLQDKISGKTGELVTFLPQTALFRTDPYDNGIAQEWYEPDAGGQAWKSISTARPFYLQGYVDKQGHRYAGPMWYQFKVSVPASAAGKRIMLYAPVVETEGWCWMNGEYLGHRKYIDAYLRPNAMEFDVTGIISPGKINVVTVRVDTGGMQSQDVMGIYCRPFLYSPKPAEPEQL